MRFEARGVTMLFTAAVSAVALCAHSQESQPESRSRQRGGPPARHAEQGTLRQTEAVPLEVLPPSGSAREARLRNYHAAASDVMTAESVKRLEMAWFVQTPDHVSNEPLLAGGFVYAADWNGNAYKIRAADGAVQWQRKLLKPEDWPWRGLAGTGDIVGDVWYLASVEGTAFALDTSGGDVLWQSDFADDPHAGSLARVLVHDGTCYLGVQSVEESLAAKKHDFRPDFRGRVVALDAESGDKKWEAVLTDADSPGVAVWTGFALDPQLGLLYFTTGNTYGGEPAPLGDSIVAVALDSGKIAWSRQGTANDVWTMANPIGPDWDFVGAPQLFEAEIGGRRRELLGAAQKNGVFHVVDRRTGETVWTSVIGQSAKLGGMHAEASIGRNVVLIWGNNSYPPKGNPVKHPMDIAAVDVATGRHLWVYDSAQPAGLTSAGFLAGDVYFVGSLDGCVRAYSARNGERLWKSATHGSVASSIAVRDGSLYFGAGVPANFGGNGQADGIVCYRLPSEDPGGRQAARAARRGPLSSKVSE